MYGPVVRRTALIALVSLCILAGPAPAATPNHGWSVRCGSQPEPGAGWYNVRGFNVTCSTARHVARHFWNSGGDTRFEGWRCHHQQTGYETSRGDCTRKRSGKHQHIRFEFGA